MSALTTCRSIHDGTEPTSWVERFCAVLSRFCNGVPPIEIVQGWCQGGNDERLQAWVQTRLMPSATWMQSLALIDAAERLADRPAEDGPHAERPVALRCPTRVVGHQGHPDRLQLSALRAAVDQCDADLVVEPEMTLVERAASVLAMGAAAMDDLAWYDAHPHRVNATLSGGLGRQWYAVTHEFTLEPAPSLQAAIRLARHADTDAADSVATATRVTAAARPAPR